MNVRRHLNALVPWRRRDAAVRNEAAQGRSTDLQRFFDELWPGAFGGRHGDWLAPWRMPDLTDLVEDDAGYTVRVDVPGYDAADLDVALAEDRLTVRAERATEEGEWHGDEGWSRSAGRFFYETLLPAGGTPDGATASVRNGVLTVRIPKTEEARRRTRRIEVKAA